MRFLFLLCLVHSSLLLADGQQSGAQPTMFESLVPFILIFIIMYFLIIRPQAKKAKEHNALLSSLKPGDEVVTSGGIIGRIRSLAEGFVVLDAGSTTLKVLKENISQMTHPKATHAKPADKTK